MKDISIVCNYSDRTDFYNGIFFTGGYIFLSELLSVGIDGRIISRRVIKMKNKIPPHPMPMMRFR